MVLFKGFLQFFFNFYYVGTCAVSITQACFFVRPRSFFSTSFLGTITWCPQPMHFRRKSAPTRMISHSLLPHGCGFFSFTISPTAYLSILYSFSTYICHIIYYDMRVKRYFALILHLYLFKYRTQSLLYQKVCSCVHRCGGLVDKHELVSVVIVYEACRRIYRK